MRLLLVFLALAISWVQPATAINGNAGTTGFNFLKIGVGARAAALGGAFTAVAGDVESSAWNPAGLLGVRERTAALSLNSYLVDTQAGFVSVALPNEQRVWAISANYVTYGNMQRTDGEGRDLGSFSAADMAAYISVAQPFWKEWLTLGASLKAIYSSIDEFSSDAYAFDLGLLARGPVQGMHIGASLSNLGFVRSAYAGDFKDELPVHMRIGLAHRPAHMPLPMLLLADFNVPNDNDPYLSLGLEVQLASGLYLRPGYSLQQTGSADEEALGLTAGAGFSAQRYRLDYAYSSFPDLGDVHRVSVVSNF
jgi:hypothetical protein